MKKLIAVFLAAALLVLCVPAVSAAGSVSLKGPDAVRAGDTITLTFSAGGDNIYGGQCSVSFDESQLTLKGYTTSSPGGSWKVENSGNSFVFYDDSLSTPLGGGKTIFKASFTVKDLEPGTEVSVSVSGIKLSDENFTDSNFGTKTYTTTILPPLSDNCNLASLTVTNAEITPAFSTDVLSYSASVPFTTSALELEAVAEHPGAQVTVGKTSLTAGGTTNVKITVKAENGAEKTYSIKVKREQDPNYVPSSDTTLQSLSVEGYQLSPAFSNEVRQYYVWLPYEADRVTIQSKTTDRKAHVDLGKTDGLVAGQATKIPVTVIAEDDTAVLFTITAFRAPAHGDTEDFLAGKGAVEPEPEPEPTATEPEPEQEPEVPKQEQQGQPVKPDNGQYIILIGVGAACLILGLLIGILIRSFSLRNIFFVEEDEEEEEEPEDGPEAPAEDALSEDMPDFETDK